MAVKSCSLNINMKGYEKDNRGTPMFPCGGYKTIVGDSIIQNIPWHWHEEVEVLVVCSGILKLELIGQCHDIREGEGAFINSNVLQSAVNFNKESCEIKSLVFHSNIIAGMIQSALDQRYVHPLLNCSKLTCIHFGSEIKWHREAVQCIINAYNYYQNELYGYELLVRNSLSKLWYLIVSNNKRALVEHQKSDNINAVRVKNMITYIHDNYEAQIQLKNIAGVVAISERECLRCFKKTIGITPIKYLLGYRLSVAAGLLTNSNLNITEISKQTGFESPSHFSFFFKKLIEMTPSDYRKSAKNILFHKA